MEPPRPRRRVERSAAPEVKAEAAILIEARSGTVLWSKAPDRRLPPASCTKIMTALIVLEHVDDLEGYATVPAIPLPQTVGVGLLPGDRITIQQALRALMVKSANDAALTLASYVAGDEPSFVRLMNAARAAAGIEPHALRQLPRNAQPGAPVDVAAISLRSAGSRCATLAFASWSARGPL